MVYSRAIGLLGLLSALMAGGCTAGLSRLTVTRQSDGQPYTQTFSKAYSSRTDDGEYQIVLVANDSESGTKHPASAVLHPTPNPPLLQIVHIRVYWRPLAGAKSDSPSATNASIDWHIFGIGSRQNIDMLHYGGIGFAWVRLDDNGLDLDIQNGTLKLMARGGAMHDALGQSTLEGKVHAVFNPQRVRTFLAETRDNGTAALSHPQTRISTAPSAPAK